jgi:glutamate-1-semialdehyde 2,1-aminomutase
MTENTPDAAAPTLPEHDPATYRRLPARTRPVDPSVVERLLAQEWERFETWSAGSGEHNKRASEVAAARCDELLPALGPVPDQRSPRRGARG